MANLADALADVVGASHVRTSDLSSYGRDWTGRWNGIPRLAVVPGTAEEIGKILRICADGQIGVVPHGGNTGLVGGGVPDGDVVLDLRRLNSVVVDAVSGQVRA